nr:MAG TPA: hypothetical protein [Caudoviricetes sp.]
MERIKGFLWGIMTCILISILTGCKSVQFVPVETVKTDSFYIDRFQRDSIYQRDSVFVNRWTAGDTVYQDKVVWKYVYRDKVKYDTVAILRSDTVRVPYPVERRLTTWEQVRLNVGGWAIGAVIIFILIVVGIIVYKLKQCN